MKGSKGGPTNRPGQQMRPGGPAATGASQSAPSRQGFEDNPLYADGPPPRPQKSLIPKALARQLAMIPFIQSPGSLDLARQELYSKGQLMDPDFEAAIPGSISELPFARDVMDLILGKGKFVQDLTGTGGRRYGLQGQVDPRAGRILVDLLMFDPSPNVSGSLDETDMWIQGKAAQRELENENKLAQMRQRTSALDVTQHLNTPAEPQQSAKGNQARTNGVG